MHPSLARVALMSGNLVTGLAVLAPSGMLPELSRGLQVGIRDAGLLVTYGAVVVCVCSPLVSWLTARVSRRLLMTGTLVALVLGHLASAFADSYAAVLALRLLMLVFAAIYTPQAASTIALLVPEKERASAISFVFLGWSLAIATGLPLITFLATQFGWRETYLAIALCAAVSALLNAVALPNALKGHPLSLQSFAVIARNTALVTILLITLLQMSGQFAITVYLAPLLMKLTDAGPAAAGVFFSLLGVGSFLGNLAASQIVTRLGLPRTLGLFMLLTTSGAALWSLGAGAIVLMGAGIALLGLGNTAANSMQQARLVVAAPALAGATVALNTSVLYVGQALGSAAAGLLYENGLYRAAGFVAVAFFLSALVVFLLTVRRPASDR
jgi:predicted MFS family arabinose efflux permease